MLFKQRINGNEAKFFPIFVRLLLLYVCLLGSYRLGLPSAKNNKSTECTALTSAHRSPPHSSPLTVANRRAHSARADGRHCGKDGGKREEEKRTYRKGREKGGAKEQGT